MATTNPCSSHLLSASTHFHGFPKMSLKIHSPFLHKLKVKLFSCSFFSCIRWVDNAFHFEFGVCVLFLIGFIICGFMLFMFLHYKCLANEKIDFGNGS